MGMQLTRGQSLVMQHSSGSEHSPSPHMPLSHLPCMKILSAIKRKALLMADIVASAELGPCLKKHGIIDLRYGKRLLQQVRTTYSLSQAPHNDRPPKIQKRSSMLHATC